MSALQIVLLLIGVVLLTGALVLFLRAQWSRAASSAPPEYQIFGTRVRDEGYLRRAQTEGRTAAAAGDHALTGGIGVIRRCFSCAVSRSRRPA